MSCPPVAHLPRAALRLFFIEQVIELAAQADAERRFEEQENEAKHAAQAAYRAVGIDDDHQHKHQARQPDADRPCKFLLFGANVFRHL